MKFDIARQSRRLRFARRLRRRLTLQENILWTLLRGRRLDGLKFRRQAAIGPYIVDFLCMQYRLIVEIDGASHHDRTGYDACRDEYLRALRYRVLRFTNTQVEQALSSVLETILRAIFDKNTNKTSPFYDRGLRMEKDAIDRDSLTGRKAMKTWLTPLAAFYC